MYLKHNLVFLHIVVCKTKIINRLYRVIFSPFYIWKEFSIRPDTVVFKEELSETSYNLTADNEGKKGEIFLVYSN